MLLELLTVAIRCVRNIFRGRADFIAEVALLRQQVIVLQRGVLRPNLQRRDRAIIAALTKLFPAILGAVRLVQPATVIRWHRSLALLIWRIRSRGPVGRPTIDQEAKDLIRRMWRDNPLGGEDRIAAEMAKLGHRVSPRTVARYRPANLPRGRGQKWSTFIRNHLAQTWACDWFTVTTLTFRTLYAFVIVDLGRREIARIGVTAEPGGQFASQCFVEAVADCHAPALRQYVRYHRGRPHRGLGMQAPLGARWLGPARPARAAFPSSAAPRSAPTE